MRRKSRATGNDIRELAADLEAALKPLHLELRAKSDFAPVITARYILTLLSAKFERWLGGFQPPLVSDVTLNEPVATFNQRHLRQVSIRARRALVNWTLGRYPLNAVDHIVTPEEMLRMQSHGRRAVTLLFSKAELASAFGEHRDALEFVLHDLVHADQFYSDPDRQRGQIAFYQFVRRLNQILPDSLWPSPLEREKFDYVISDMNSHCVHLYCQLVSALREVAAADAVENWLREVLPENAPVGLFSPIRGKLTDSAAGAIEDFFVATPAKGSREISGQ